MDQLQIRPITTDGSHDHLQFWTLILLFESALLVAPPLALFLCDAELSVQLWQTDNAILHDGPSFWRCFHVEQQILRAELSASTVFFSWADLLPHTWDGLGQTFALSVLIFPSSPLNLRPLPIAAEDRFWPLNVEVFEVCSWALGGQDRGKGAGGRTHEDVLSKPAALALGL